MAGINVPVMGIYGKRDVIVHPNQWKLVEKYAQEPLIHYLGKSGHFPMLDEPENFQNMVFDFLSTPTPKPEKPAPPSEQAPSVPQPEKELVAEEDRKPSKPRGIA